MAKAKDDTTATPAPVRDSLRELAQEIFVRSVMAGSHGKTPAHVAEQAFELAAAFEEVAATK
jgi:ABC-type phosphate/phosphonate transport system substrate-binding protein